MSEFTRKLQVINTLATTLRERRLSARGRRAPGGIRFLQQSGSSHQQKTPVMNRGLMSAV
ncbi:hypothetical protein N0Y54_43965 [Nostoc punctiforme UO1]|uniref:hypothetical protein n=1 Tax=Nostoc punctiforme TaxID=272131 RepID=UPI0030AF178D